MANEHLDPPHPNTETAATGTDHPVDKTSLALQRAAAADAWRAYVELGALIHRQCAQTYRQRAQAIESDYILATKREQLAVQEIERLNSINTDLIHQHNAIAAELAEQKNELAKLLDSGVIKGFAYLCRRKLMRSRLGPILRATKEKFQTPSTARPISDLPVAHDDGLQQTTHTDAPPHALQDTLPQSAATMLPFEGHRKFTLSKKNVLVISTFSHDTSLGRFALDLVDSLGEECNVLLWQMSTGPLVTALQHACCELVLNVESRNDYSVARQVAFDIADRHHSIDFAVILTQKAKSALPALAERSIPVLGLLHDEAAYGTPVYELQEYFYWATHTSFTTLDALQYAQRICLYLNKSATSVSMPGPGPHSTPQLTASAIDDSRLPPPLRKNSTTAPQAVVLGFGPVNYNSGVDLFVACADAVLRGSPDKGYRFAWLAQANNKNDDPGYPFAIQNQINQLSLQDHVSIIYEPLADAIPSMLVDVVLMPARTEIFQHNAVQALMQGIPVLAFSNITRLAEMLDHYELATSCLTRMGDIPALARKTLALLENSAHRTALSNQIKTLDWQSLTLNAYVAQVVKHGMALKKQLEQERDDERVILRSGHLRPDYMGTIVHHTGTLDCSDARLYVRGSNSGVGARKPRPGLLPRLYAESRMDASSIEEPYAHYLRHHCPPGPWQYPVIEPDGKASAPTCEKQLRVALHIHAYYPDMLEEMLARINQNTWRPDLFISVKDEASRTHTAAVLESYTGQICTIEIVPNKGRDIGPFLTTFGQTLVENYDLIGHVHTKRSDHADRQVVEMWRHFLLENLLGGHTSGNMMDTIISGMANHPDWGIAFPDDPVPLGWDTNRNCANALAAHMIPGDLPEHFCFPAGTMFWIRANALQPFVSLNLQYSDYPIEPLPIDGTLLHALERLFGVVPRSLGMECALTSVPGVSR